jgi:hypothetical protein
MLYIELEETFGRVATGMVVCSSFAIVFFFVRIEHSILG